eukprot:10995716-Lingulodinium_polyedra.AAC.1
MGGRDAGPRGGTSTRARATAAAADLSEHAWARPTTLGRQRPPARASTTRTTTRSSGSVASKRQRGSRSAIGRTPVPRMTAR